DLRGFDYYTGVRFAGYAGGAPDAVLRGGRYDELIARDGRAARATGCVLDLEAPAQAQRSSGLPAPAQSLRVAVHGRGAPALARALRGHGIRAVTASAAPSASWLKSAGLDAGLVLDQRRIVRADGAERTLETSEPQALVKLLEEDRCPS